MCACQAAWHQTQRGPCLLCLQLRALNRANNIKINEDYSVMMTEVGKVRVRPLAHPSLEAGPNQQLWLCLTSSALR